MMKKGTRVWMCDGCGKRETWRKGWCYFAHIASPSNKHEDRKLTLPLAVCSEACGDVALLRLAL